MTKREAVVISAYTGVMLTKDFADVHKFCEELLGRPILSHEFAYQKLHDEVSRKCKPLILEIVRNETEEVEHDG